MPAPWHEMWSRVWWAIRQRGRRGEGEEGEGGGVFDPCAAHSLVRFVDPLHWLPQRPPPSLPPLLCEDVGTSALWQ